MLLDTSSLLYRAFFGVPKDIKDATGRPVNALRGYLDMLATLAGDRPVDQIVSAFDADWRPAFRVALYAGYKADRAEEPPELTPQFELLPEVLDAAGLPRAQAAGFEAEDVIASLVRSRGNRGTDFIVTGDRDLLCLVRDPNVLVLFTVKGVRQLKEFDEAAVLETYGVRPEQYCEFAMMRGDPSDGLPGVPGIGPTRASRLLSQFGSLETILANLDTLPPKQRAAFGDSRAYLEAVGRLVPPAADAEVELVPAGEPDIERLTALARAHNLEGPTKRLLAALGKSTG